VFEHVEGIRSKNRRGALPAAGAAALAHVVLILLLVWGFRSNILVAGQPFGDGPALAFPEGGGGGGGGSGGEEVVSYVELAPTPQPETVVEPVPVEDVLVPPEPTPVPEPPKPEAPRVDAPPTPQPAATPAPATAGQGAGNGGGAGAGQGPGEGPGTGPGSGGGSGGGDGGGIGSGQGPGTGGGASRIRPPRTDLMLIPPDRPRGVGSQSLTITLRVDVRGRVRDARLNASTGNRGYDERVRRWAMDLVFRPAVNMDTNRPEEVDYPIEISI
jgi:outer membrane biosynthesis protein TonB